MADKLQILDKSRLGRLLVNKGYISDQQLNEALIASHASGQRLGEYLIARELISEKQLKQTLRRQTRVRKTATFMAMLFAPLQPMIAFGAHAATAQTTNTSTASVTALKITAQPKSVDVTIGQKASFSVSATGKGLTYSWAKDSVMIKGATSSTFTLTSVKSTDVGRYNVRVMDQYGNKQWTQMATLTVVAKVETSTSTSSTAASSTSTAPTTTTATTTTFGIVSHPQDISIAKGQTATFSVGATGTGLTYNWAKDQVMIRGATSPTLSLVNVSAADRGRYNVRVMDKSGNKKWSSMASLTVTEQAVTPVEPPTTTVTSPTTTTPPAPAPSTEFGIVSQPQDTTVTEGQTATFSVSATGSGLTYSWAKDQAMIRGATSSTLSLSNVTSADMGRYNVRVMDQNGNKKWTSMAALTVEKQVAKTPVLDIAISMQPTASRVFAGASHTLNISASGSGTLKYQWRKNGVLIPNAVQSYLSLSSLKLSDAGQYDVLITNDTGTLTSAAAQLDVIIDRTAKLKWIAPNTRVNGTALKVEDIAAYRIYHSSEDGTTEAVYDVAANQSSYELDNLASGRHYFAITAIDTKGLESELSNMRNKEITTGL